MTEEHMTEAHRTALNLRNAFAAIAVAGVFAAIVVTILTGGKQDILTDVVVSPLSGSFFTEDSDDCFNGTELEDCFIPVSTHPDFPGRQFTVIEFVDFETTEEGVFAGTRIATMPGLAYWSRNEGGPGRGGTNLQAVAVSPLGEELNESKLTAFGSQEFFGELDGYVGGSFWVGADAFSIGFIRQPILETFVSGEVLELTYQLLVDYENGRQEVLTATSLVTTDVSYKADTEIKLVPITEFADPDGVNEVDSRALGLLPIWGTTFGALALIGLVGSIVGRLVLRVAHASDDRAGRLETLAHGFAHDLKSPIRQIGSAGARLGRQMSGADELLLLTQINNGATEMKDTLERFADVTGVDTDD